ncbi:MAG: Pr6Pr family membrane protein [Chthoniobacterales bacterium]
MTKAVAARIFFALSALAVLVGLIVQLFVSAGLTGSQFTSPGSRIFNVFCYFTVQSNALVGITTGLLASRLHRRSNVFRAIRLAGLIGITVTGIVFHVALAHLQDLEGTAAVADFVLHTLVPVLAVAGWLGFGPRGMTSWRVGVLAVIFPVAWLTFALVRGELIDFYAYPFIDVRQHGYLQVFANAALVAVLFFLLAAGAIILDRWLSGLGKGAGRVAASDAV